ncbi:MAG TPA: hypothetical protein VGM37_11205 [Armatimonadota bacterium]|jgi:hypothetical protein
MERHFPSLLRAVLVGAFAAVAVSAQATSPTGNPQNPYGDLAGATITPPSEPDGMVTLVDSALIQSYLFTPNLLTDAQKDRVRRFGDIAYVTNRNTVGNGVVDTHDTQRHLLLAGGLIDCGTATTYRADYGDVDGDSLSTIVDAVLIQRFLAGKVSDPTILTRVHTRGLGDISPTIPFVTFGDGQITAEDAAAVEARATGTETDVPAYVDYWPLHSPNTEFPTTVRDTYVFTDVNGLSGDALNQIRFQTANPVEMGGYTVTPVLGDDSTELGVFKGTDGSVYILYVQAPNAFGLRRVTFSSPIKLIDPAQTAPGSRWSGWVTSTGTGLGQRPTPYTVTVLGFGDEWTPAAGSFTAAGIAPASTWSKTLKLRLCIALLPGTDGGPAMQQSFFYDFAPFIGMVSRGQAAVRGAAAPTADKPFWQLDRATVRGITFAP